MIGSDVQLALFLQTARRFPSFAGSSALHEIDIRTRRLSARLRVISFQFCGHRLALWKGNKACQARDWMRCGLFPHRNQGFRELLDPARADA